MSKRALAAVAFVAAMLVFGGLIGTIQYFKNRPVAEPTATAFVEITSANFKQEIMQTQIPVYLVFYVNEKCADCDAQLALVEKISSDYAGKVKFARINAITEKGITRANGVKMAPTSFFLNPTTGNIVGAEGLMSEEELRKFLDTGLNAPAAAPDPAADPGNGGAPPAPAPDPAVPAPNNGTPAPAPTPMPPPPDPTPDPDQDQP